MLWIRFAYWASCAYHIWAVLGARIRAYVWCDGYGARITISDNSVLIKGSALLRHQI